MKSHQANYDIRCEWGEQGVLGLSPTGDVVIIVDVLSFSTCVDMATARGATVYPYQWEDARAREFAIAIDAELAVARGAGRFSLSPSSFLDTPTGTSVVLPSPNGASLSLATRDTITLAGCLRNASAVAKAALRLGKRISVIPAGERWEDNSLRPSLEDWLGARSGGNYQSIERLVIARGSGFPRRIPRSGCRFNAND
jgi:2-phosphosulfolactate phosphatase